MSNLGPPPVKKYSLKLILVGSTGVGKTSLVSCYLKNPFDSQALPTVAPASCAASVTLENNIQVELQIWDTAGQERFQSISKMFYRDANVALVCYDSTTNDSIGNWIGKVREEVSDCIIFLVATKVDLLDEDQTAECLRFGEEKQGEFGARVHLLTSSLNATGVTELFTEAAKCVRDVYLTNQPSVEIANTEPKPAAGTCC
jgi:small GTP-binding protein